MEEHSSTHESENMETKKSSSPASTSNSTNMLLVGVIVLLLIAGGGYVFYRKVLRHLGAPAPQQVSDENKPADGAKAGGKMMVDMTPKTPPPITADQQKQVDLGPSKKVTEKTFDIVAGNFFFVPNALTVNKGDKVTINFKSGGGFHDFTLDQFNVKIGPVATDGTGTATFTADKTGSFEFYCSVGKHRQLGQKGTLIVQ